jgi:hypothetical protein
MPNALTWKPSAAVPTFYGTNYLFVNTAFNANTYVDFLPVLPADGAVVLMHVS